MSPGGEVSAEGQRVRELSRRVEQLESEAEIARRLAAFDMPGPKRERIYRFIESETANFAVRRTQLLDPSGARRRAWEYL